ncbi:MAG: hypothetical protein HYS27_03780 [Deltaproteobacteria bacterium]|nr:hypothetical protein [Deltaproteobacteria bacterium]
MRSMLAVLIVAMVASASRAQDAPPEPLEVPPAAEVAPPLPVDEPPPPIEPPTDKKPPDFTPAPKPKAPDKKPPPPEAPAVGFGGDACWGSSMACVGGACLPGAATALGATILISTIGAGVAEGGCGGVVLVILGTVYGIIIGAPGALLLGPCASCSAAAGGITMAALNDRDLLAVTLGSLPGIALGLLGSGGVLWGLLALDGANGDFTVPVALLASGVGLALLSGPATIIGISVADGMAGEGTIDDAKKPVPKPDDPRADPGKTQVAMRY